MIKRCFYLINLYLLFVTSKQLNIRLGFCGSISNAGPYRFPILLLLLLLLLGSGLHPLFLAMLMCY